MTHLVKLPSGEDAQTFVVMASNTIAREIYDNRWNHNEETYRSTKQKCRSCT